MQGLSSGHMLLHWEQYSPQWPTSRVVSMTPWGSENRRRSTHTYRSLHIVQKKRTRSSDVSPQTGQTVVPGIGTPRLVATLCWLRQLTWKAWWLWQFSISRGSSPYFWYSWQNPQSSLSCWEAKWSGPSQLVGLLLWLAALVMSLEMQGGGCGLQLFWGTGPLACIGAIGGIGFIGGQPWYTCCEWTGGGCLQSYCWWCWWWCLCESDECEELSPNHPPPPLPLPLPPLLPLQQLKQQQPQPPMMAKRKNSPKRPIPSSQTLR